MIPARLLFRCALARTTSRRLYSAAAAPPPAPKPTSQHITIYKDFGRPFAKVFLMAIFTYQALYWTWMKLEKDEEKRTVNERVAELEAKVAELRPAP